MDYVQIVTYLFLSAAVVGLFVKVARDKRKVSVEAMPAETEAPVRKSNPPEISPPRRLSEREQRDVDIRARYETGCCLYCDRSATHARPRVKLVTSLLDPLYRRLGVVPRDQYQLEVHSRTESDIQLCEDHHVIARSRLECKLAEISGAFAQHVIRERDGMIRFQRYEVDEDMKNEAETTRRGKPQVSVLRSVNGG